MLPAGLRSFVITLTVILWSCLLVTRAIWDTCVQCLQMKPSNLQVQTKTCWNSTLYCLLTFHLLADNGLSFIETSALDSSNVELSFQRILTGMFTVYLKDFGDLLFSSKNGMVTLHVQLEIYRIVSNKALESSNDVIRPTGGETIVVSQSPDDQNKGGKCC